MAISTNGTIITRLAGSLYGEYLSNASYTELNTTAAATVAANMLSNDFAGKTDAEIATTVLKNLSLTTVAGLDNWVAAQLTAAGSTAAAKGAKLVSMLNDYAMMTADATYGTSATSFNTKVSAALVLSQTTGNVGGTFATAGTAPVSGGSFNLTPGADLASTTAASNSGLASSFKFTGGNESITGTSGSVTNADVLIDGSSTDSDSLTVDIVATPGSAMTAVGIEAVNLRYIAGSNPAFSVASFTGSTAYNVTGSVAGTITDAEATKINVTGYTRVLTVNETLIDGTTAGGNADVTNIDISGATFGTTAATQTGITLTAGTAGVLETLNITSSGTAANAFALDASTNVTLGTVNLLGAADITVRMDHADVTGTTVNGAVNTGSTTLLIDRNGVAAAATSLSNVAGVDILAFRDSTAGTDSLVVSGVANASTVEARSAFNVTTNSISVAGAAGSSTNVLNLTLDNSTAATRLQFGTLDVQDVETLNLASNGHDSALVAAGNAVSLTGDMTTVTVSGDTSIVVAMNIDAPASGSRTTTSSAASMTGTATVTLDASGDTNTTNLYTLTGTANGDTLLGGAGSGVLTGGVGNDSITGGAANDTIDGGEGIDTITATRGLDAVTGGAGNDIFDVNGQGVTGVAQVSTLTNINTTVALAATDVITVNIDGRNYQEIYATGATNTIAAFVTNNAAAILANHGVTVTSVDTDTDLRFVGASTGAPFTIQSAIMDAGVVVQQAVTVTTAPTLGLAQRTSISDFAAGDVLDLAGLATTTTLVYFEGLVAAATATATINVLTDAAGFADAEAAEDAIIGNAQNSTVAADSIIVFLNSTLGFAQVVIDPDGDNAADAANLGDSTGTNVIINLTGITTAAQLIAAFSDASFVL